MIEANTIKSPMVEIRSSEGMVAMATVPSRVPVMRPVSAQGISFQ